MTAIRHSLQQELFKPMDEVLYSVVNVAKSGGGKKKKNSFLCVVVTKAKCLVRIYKVQKTEKETYKKKVCWQLSDLKTVDGKDETQDRLEFDLHFEKVYHWTASRIVDRNDFLSTLWTLANRIGDAKKPQFVNVSQQILELDLTSKIQQGGAGGTGKGGREEGSEDYQKLTPKEESDINTKLSQFEDALTNVEAFTEQLSSELQQLEYINITSLMGSEQQAKDLLGLIDRSCEQLNVLDNRLTKYDDYLQRVQAEMGQMEFKDNKMEIQRINNKQLLEEIKYIVGKLDISQRHIRALQEGDLYNPHGIEECISASKILLDAVNTPFKPGISELHAVQEQVANIENYKAQFANRFYTHLDKFISQHSNVDLVAYKPSNELSLPAHDEVHDEFTPYIDLMKWLKDLDNVNYNAIKSHYEDQFTEKYKKEFGQYMDFARMRAAMKVKDSGKMAAPSSLTSQLKTGSKLNISRLKGKSKLKRSGSHESISSSVSAGSSTSSMYLADSSGTHFDQVFDIVLSELEPYVSAEQDFCAKFFHLHYPGENGDSDEQNLNTSTTSDSADGALLSHPSSTSSSTKVVDEVRDMMSKIFGFLELEMQSFIIHGESLHPHNILYCMSRIQNQSQHLVTSHANSTPPTFLGSMFGGWLVYTKRQFDKYIDTLVQQIKDVKTQKKKKGGLLHDVMTVEKFFKASEAIFCGSERRAEIDKAYKSIIKELVKKIELVAEENDKPPPETVMFENYHYLHSIIRGLKNPNLDAEKKLAEKSYYDAMHLYISSRLGRPLERISRFFNGVEACINSGVRMEDVGYQLALNQQELKNIIKEYPPKEVKKGLEVLYRKMEKYVTEAGLKQVMWHNLQEAFVRQYERYQELVDLCYPNSNILLPVTVDEILEFFSSIALSN